MKSRTLNITSTILYTVVSLLLFLVITPQMALAGMSPRDGVVRTTTGAPIPGVTVVEYTDWCPPAAQVEQMMPGCPYPRNCHNERSAVTDGNGRYYFEPMTPPIPENNPCELNVWWRYTCSNPEVFYKILAPNNAQASGMELIPSAYAAETPANTGPGVCPPVSHPTSNVPSTITTDLTCNIKVACGKNCTTPAECDGAHDGCTQCLPNSTGTGNTCRKALACNASCSTDFDCAGAAEGCTVCVPNAAGTAKTCKKPPKCGQACTRNDECAGSREGCTVCDPNETGQKICQEPFDEKACKCDGFEAVALQYPSVNPFVFDAFAKVEGTDLTKAVVQGLKFRMYEADKSNPNSATVIAESQMYTPELVSSTAEKARYKARWTMNPPQIKANKTYRVLAEIKCARKKKTPTAQLPTNQYQSRVLGLIAEANAQEPGASTDPNYLQLTNLNFVKQVNTDKCYSAAFELQEGIGSGQ